MTKLALCFSGDTRNYKLCFESIKLHLIDKFDCDIFISTYQTNDEIKDDIINLYKPKKYIFNDKDNIARDVSIYLNNLENVKTNNIHVFEYKKIESINFTNNFTNNNFEDFFFNYDQYETKFQYKKLNVNALCQFFGIYDVSKLCKEYMIDNTIQYDFILRLRLDDKFYNNFILNELEENEILINCIEYYSDSIKLQDYFFMCKPNTFFKIASLYNNLYNIIETINNNNCWLPNSGYQETLLLLQTMLHQVKIKIAPFYCGKLK
jgi:hypothetical protein